MAIYHLHVKVIGRKSGSSAVASAAYRSGSRLRDERLDRSHDFSAKRGVVHSEVMLPEHAPQAWSDRERLWNDVEAFEIRKDAQLAREVEFAIPREMSEAQGIELARDFARGEFVDRGMIADLNVHWDMAEDGMPKPHAHVMLTMRAVDESGFGQKVREWNRTEMVQRWRERWAELANEPNSTSTRASTIAAWRRRASRWSPKTRSARPRIALRIGASRARGSRPTARRCTAR
jgi:MobA/MobL family